MARYLCQMCYNVVTYGENHPCFYYKNDEKVYSLPRTGNSKEIHDEAKDKSMKISKDDLMDLNQPVHQNIRKKSELVNVSLFQNNGEDNLLPSRGNRCTFSAQSSNDEQKRKICDNSYFNPISDVQMTEVQFQVDASVTTSSENVESSYRPENDFRESNNISPIVMESTGVEEIAQRESGNFDLIHETGREEFEMSRQKNKWMSLDNDKISFMDSPKSMIGTDNSDNRNIIRLRNALAYPTLLGNNEPEEGKMHNSENVIESHTSLEMHCHPQCKSEIVNSDFPSGSNKQENGWKHGSVFEFDGHTSVQMHSDVYSKSEKTASTVKQHISFEADNNAVAGPSGVRPRKRKFPCPLCPKDFSSQHDRDKHHRSHFVEKPFTCKMCKKAFTCNYDLISHMRTHTGEKPFVCKICEKAFSHNSNLKVHLRKHTLEKPFICKICEKAFSQNSHLKTHLRKHTLEKPFVCNICEKGFSQNCLLRAHAWTHTGEKPYKCPICGKAFTTSSARNKHQREMHE